MTLLGVIYALEDVEHERGAIIYGGLDMIPRCNMAYNLALYHKAPVRISKELKSIRAALQGGIAERRNQAVHGAHSDTDNMEVLRLTMVRFKGEKRTQDVSLEQMIELTEQIHALQRRAYVVFDAIGTWKFGDHLPINTDSQVSESNSSPNLVVTKSLYARLKHFFGNP